VGAYTVPGSHIFWLTVLSPLSLAVDLITVGSVALIALIIKKLPPGGRGVLRAPGWARRHAWLLVLIVLVLDIAIIFTASYVTARPGLDYGIWVEGRNVTVRFYENKVIAFSVCDASFNLTSTSKALGLLRIRTNGLSDPTAGIHMGYYKTVDNHRAYVIVLEKESRHAIVFRLASGDYVVVAVPGVERAYGELEGAAASCG
jgi:hypothetical protein